jgi:gluconolactonase
MTMEIEVLASGLGFPEGPVVYPDGSVVLVEIKRGTLTRIWNGRTEVIATPGGGPNGAARGPDGALYVCNNGGFEWHENQGLTVPGHAPHDWSGGRVERIDPATGKVERLFDTVDGNPLKGPNDLVFAADGSFYFTDHGKSYPRHRDYGGFFHARPDGSHVCEIVHGQTSPNGIGLSPDGSVVYMADTMTGRLWAYDMDGAEAVKPASPLNPGRVVASLPGWQLLDSLAVEAGGKVCVATIINGGITTFDPDGGVEHTPFPDPLVTNIAFGGDDMRDAYITLSGTGQLIKVRWPRPGLKLHFQA